MKDRVLTEDIIPFLPQEWGDAIEAADDRQTRRVTEVRLRAGKNICLRYGTDEIILTEYMVTVRDLAMIVSSLCHHSCYAMESELQNGYITIRGGHRVGIAGQAVLAEGKIKLLKEIGSLVIRVARQVIGAANKLVDYVRDGQRVKSTLIVAPPYCGKTTILRDLIRLLSDGDAHHRGVQVALADERSELASVYRGLPMLNVGARTDVVCGAPKAEAMMLLVRAMSPCVVATDELGKKEDFVAVEEALHMGVVVIATLHGQDWRDVVHRMDKPQEKVLSLFHNVIFLTNRPTMGTIREVTRYEEVCRGENSGVSADIVCGDFDRSKTV